MDEHTNNKSVPYYFHESEMLRMESERDRCIWIIVAELVMLVASNLYWIVKFIR